MWRCTFTWRGRYDELGIPCIIDTYSKQLGVDSLVVVDVGCSKGATLNDCQRLLTNRGVTLETIGIDQSPKIKIAAEENLDEFLLTDVLSVKNRENIADVVICANMLRNNVSHLEKISILKKCTQFLKPHGILILASPFPDQFGRHPTKNESYLYDPSTRRKVMRCLLAMFPPNLLNEILILNKIDAEKLSEYMLSTR